MEELRQGSVLSRMICLMLLSCDLMVFIIQLLNDKLILIYNKFNQKFKIVVLINFNQ
jgi:hypothetical protein